MNASPHLRPYAVDVLTADLDVEASHTEELVATLSTDERERATCFRFPLDRTRFIARRALLRRFLAERLALPAAKLRYSCDTYGKLRLTGSAAVSNLRFSVSHSGSLALFAFSNGREIGVDVERIDRDRAALDAATLFFSPSEVDELRSLPEHRRPLAFFHCWTRKEAFVKARGTGLQLPLDQFDVALRPDEPASLRATRWDPAEASRWSLVTLAPGEGFVGALAIEGRPPIVTMRKENPPCDEPRIW